jgi:hypothetical protein
MSAHRGRRRGWHLADDGSTIVVVTAATAGVTGASYHDHEQVLLPGAQAGLRHLHEIIPLDANDGRDTFTYATTGDTAAPSRDRSPAPR